MEDLKQYIRMYMNITDEDLDIFASYFHVTILAKGDFFLKAGKVSDKFSFQNSGLMRVFAFHEEKEVTQWISYKGNIITDINSFVFDEPSTFNIQALNACELYTISKKDHDELRVVMPNWAELERRLLTRCFGFMEKRVFSLLALTAEERYKYMFAQNPALFTEVPLKYLASMMGMTPESLSRIRKSMDLYALPLIN